MAVGLFWIFAFLSVAGAVGMVTRKNPVTAVMCLVGTILSLSVLFVMLYAHFLAVIQVLVYAGAIMVLFVFVVMILNKEEEDPWAGRGVFQPIKILSFVGLAYLVVRLLVLVGRVQESGPMTAEELATFGTTKQVGQVMFTTYLFPFEIVSIVLLTAVVGALVIAHPGHAVAPPEQR